MEHLSDDELPADQAQAVRERVVDERSYQEIAARMRCSPSVVRKRVSRGLGASRERARTALETAIASDQRGVLDLREPVATQLLRRLPGGGVVAVVGTTPRGEKAVCVAVQERDVSGSSCGAAAELLSTERPWFVFGGIGRSSDEVVALVPDDVTSVRMQLEGGATRSLPVANNLAYAETGRPICRVTWTMADGRTGHQRGPTRAEEATPGDPKPRTCD